MKAILRLAGILAALLAVFMILRSGSDADAGGDAAADGPAGSAVAAAVGAPAPADYAEQLAAYSGHGEWVRYAAEDGAEITGYIAFPERPTPAPAVIVIHEIFGMSDWVRTVVHDIAERGYVALAPDLLSRVGGTEGADDARAAIGGLDADGITMDLDATKTYLQSLSSVNGDRVAVIGFCWGGRQTFRYATNAADIDAAVVCYGDAPDAEAISRIEAPVLGVYAENDARINTELPEVEATMEAAGKAYDYEIYAGANHGFLRSRNVPEEADRAWANVFAFLAEKLGG